MLAATKTHLLRRTRPHGYIAKADRTKVTEMCIKVRYAHPLTGIITHAYLTLSGPAVPEPAALSLFALLPLLLRRVR